MRWRCFVVATAVALSSCSGGSSPSQSPQPSSTDAVRTVWNDYREAVLAHDGKRAVGLLDETILPFYDRMRQLALTGSQAEVRATRMVDQVSVLLLRTRMDTTLLRTGTAADVVAGAVDLGLVAEENVTRLSVGEVEVADGTATAGMVDDGRSVPIRLLFQRRGAHWRLDLLPLLETADAALQALAARQGRTPDAMVDTLVAARVGPQRAAQAWTPLGTG